VQIACTDHRQQTKNIIECLVEAFRRSRRSYYRVQLKNILCFNVLVENDDDRLKFSRWSYRYISMVSSGHLRVKVYLRRILALRAPTKGL